MLKLARRSFNLGTYNKRKSSEFIALNQQREFTFDVLFSIQDSYVQPVPRVLMLNEDGITLLSTADNAEKEFIAWGRIKTFLDNASEYKITFVRDSDRANVTYVFMTSRAPEVKEAVDNTIKLLLRERAEGNAMA